MSINLTEKIQVLIGKEDLKKINSIILNEALDNGERPVPLSTFVRNLLKREIELYDRKKSKTQESFVKRDIQKIIKK